MKEVSTTHEPSGNNNIYGLKEEKLDVRVQFKKKKKTTKVSDFHEIPA